VNVESKKLFKQLLEALTIDDPNDEKETIIYWLMQHKLGLSLADILANKQVQSDDDIFADAIARLNNDEPLQYVLGETEFFGRTFLVTPNVLIPRPETELLVRHVIDQLKTAPRPSIIDIGTGSGCISVSLALGLPGSRVEATDVSLPALGIAKQNAARLGASVTIRQHNILAEPLVGGLDAVVSNPPYVLNTERSTMQKRVTDFEPSLALFVTDADPLQFHKAIADKANQALKPGGLITLEINEQLGPESAVVLAERGFIEVMIMKDLARKDRFVTGRKAK
jgi:release factor glutamine methyltransferase